MVNALECRDSEFQGSVPASVVIELGIAFISIQAIYVYFPKFYFIRGSGLWS